MRRTRRFPPSSTPQNRLYAHIKAKYSTAILNMPITIPWRSYYRYGDVVIPERRIIFEYDGYKYHRSKVKDNMRDAELKGAGYATIHVNKHNFWAVINNLDEIVRRFSPVKFTQEKQIT